MGCGKRNFGEEWLHIDEARFDHIDHNNIFEFPYDNVDMIYASHLINYFENKTLNILLTYWKSKLARGGILRLSLIPPPPLVISENIKKKREGSALTYVFLPARPLS